MRKKPDDKKSASSLAKVELEIESDLAEKLKVMESHTQISQSELVSTALKRFISQHKDYFPEDYGKS